MSVIVPIFLPYFGCHHRCTYCDQASITNAGEISIASRIEHSLAPYTNLKNRSVEVGLFGGNIFGVDYHTLMTLFSFFDPYRDIIEGFRVSTKPAPANMETVDLLKEKGVTVIELGIPTFNNAILHSLNRHHTVEDLQSTFSLLREKGFSVALQVMVGLPYETGNDIKNTIEHIIRLNPDYLRIYPLVIFRGTPLFSQYEERTFSPISFDEVLLRTSLIYLSALKQNIKVAKIGLTANEIIEEGIAGGYYHPAFGYLVKARVFYEALQSKLNALPHAKKVTILLNPKDIPHLLGYKRSHVRHLTQQGISMEWKEMSCREGTFFIEWEDAKIECTIFDALPILQGTD